MKTLRILIIGVLAFATAACGSRKEELDKIKALEQEVYSKDKGMNKEKGTELVKLYIGFADDHKKDSLAPACLYKAAELSINLNKGDDAIKYFDRVIEEYPDYKRIPEAIFVKGFVYEVLFKNLNKARDAYSLFLQKYPDHELVNDAKASLNNLGKTPEQILLEAREKVTSDSLVQVKKADSLAKLKKKKGLV